MQRGLRVFTLQGAIEKTPILLSQYWKNEWLDGTTIISHFDGSNNIFVDYSFIILYFRHPELQGLIEECAGSSKPGREIDR